MPKLSSNERMSLRSAAFGLPEKRAYPMPDRSHAANAKARATQMRKKGYLSISEMTRIKSKANKILSH